MEEKSGEQIKSNEKKDKKEKALQEAESAEDDQFEEKLNGRKEKKKKKKKKKNEEFGLHGTDSPSRVSEKLEGSEIDMVAEKNKEKLDGRKEKKTKKKKEEFGSHGTDSASRVNEKMEGSEIDMVDKQNKEKLDGRKEKKKKKEEFGSHGTDSTSRVSEFDMVEKKNNKRKRAIDREDLAQKEKKKKRMSKGNSAGLDKDTLDEEMIDISRDNLKLKKEKKKNLSGAGAIELEERNKDENGDDRLEERKQEKYEVEKKKRKKEKGGNSGNVEKEIIEEKRNSKEGSKTNKRVKKAFKSEEKSKSGNKKKGKKTTTGNNKEKKNNENRKERKKVQFSDKVEVFSEPSKRFRDETEGFVWGKRFTEEEDATLLKAIDDYIKVKQLGEKGREIVFDAKKHKLEKNMWPEIATCLPHRHRISIYFRARKLLQRNATEWTPEDYENLRQFQAAHGNNWRKFADLHSKNCGSVKDAWRMIKLSNQNKGHWNQEEIQKLFDLVNLDLRLKAFAKEPETHHVLRDNISWEAISAKLGTRNYVTCRHKWLQDLDASCIEEVDWDNLLPHRDGEICHKRWRQMVRYIGEHKEKPFIEQLDILSNRYCPEMLEYRAEKDK
ncbi:myb domain-containing protein [Carex littledalei]|uniref:Myb domain-containing protein n=1 Tax=Carex littledalei TaxID=544730 RepID=A0A833REX1_9POAL|nr:myb domain-containing protein [Carex littledalei]